MSSQEARASTGGATVSPATAAQHVPGVRPATPVVAIEPGKKRVPLNLRQLWSYPELLYFLIWRDVKVRYKQTLLGVAWAIIQPLFTTIIFTLFFGR